MTNQFFHDCLSAAMDVKKDESNKIAVIKEKKFVLTKDFVRKMLIIHERRECGVPVIIEGETGVGKTYLLHLLSLLWNDSRKQQLNHLRERVKVSIYTSPHLQCYFYIQLALEPSDCITFKNES